MDGENASSSLSTKAGQLQAAQRVSITLDYNRVRHVKNLIPDFVSNAEFFHQPHGEDLAAQLYRGLYNQEEPRQAKIRQITKNLNKYGPERVVWSMVTSHKFYRIRRPVDWSSRRQVELPTRASRDAAYLNSRLERLYEGLVGRRPTAFELTDSLQDLLVPVRTDQFDLVARHQPSASRVSTAHAQDFSISSENHTVSFDANQVLTTAILAEIAVAATLANVAAILARLGVSLIATVPMQGIAVGVVGGFITLTALVPFAVSVFALSMALTLNSQPTGQPGGQPGGDQPPPPSDPPPSDPGPPPGASMDVSVSIGDGSVGDSPGSDPGDPGDGSADGGGGAGTDGGCAGTGDGGAAGGDSGGGDGDGGGGGDGGW